MIYVSGTPFGLGTDRLGCHSKEMNIASGMTVAHDATAKDEPVDLDDQLRRYLSESYDVYCIIDANVKFSYLSAGITEHLGFEVSELLGVEVKVLLHPDEADGLLETLASLYGADGKQRPSEVARLRNAAGEWVSFELLGCGFDETSGGAVIAARQVAARRVPDRMNAVDKVLFRRLATLSSDMTLLLDAQCQSIYVSPSVASVLGHSPATAIDMPLEELFLEADRAELAAAVSRSRSEPGASVRRELRARSFDGSARWVEVTVVNLLADSSVKGIAVHLRDIHERRTTEEMLRYRANHDPLTGLPNRYWFVDHLGSANSAGRTDSAVIFCDLDRFKQINDLYGHRVGDEVLCEVARRLRVAVRPGDASARLGGDEFCVVCDGLGTVREALEIAERIRAAVAQPATIDGHTIEISVSVGVAWSGDSDEPVSTDRLLVIADKAMYLAKTSGRNRVELTSV